MVKGFLYSKIKVSSEKTYTDCVAQFLDLGMKVSSSYEIRETPIPLTIKDDSYTLLDSKSNTVFGCLDPKSVKIISVLRKELELQVFAGGISTAASDASRECTNTSGRSRQPRLTPSLGLSVIIYGPSNLAENVRLFASRCNVYLQRPLHCDRNVPYKNPQSLSPENADTIYTSSLNDVYDMEILSDSGMFLNPIDLFADSTEQETLADAASPQALHTVLYKHQKQALTFMMQRERGWGMSGHHKDIWKEETEPSGRVVYFNTVSGQKQIRPPKDFRGGLLTDAPGLGKSLSIIALIASTRESQGQIHNERALLATTLLVVPKTCKVIVLDSLY